MSKSDTSYMVFFYGYAQLEGSGWSVVVFEGKKLSTKVAKWSVWRIRSP